MSTDPALPNRAARRAAARKGGKGRKLAALGSGAVLVSGAAGMALTLSAPTVGAATTFTVDDGTDTGPVAADCTDITVGNCSLRDAIAAANVDAVEDTINFASSLSGTTITIGSDLEEIDEAVDITGPGASLLTVDGDDDWQIFTFQEVDAGTPSITGLTVANGYSNQRNSDDSGGAIALYYSDTDFTFDFLVLSSNTAYNDGGGLWCADGDTDILVSNTTFSHNVTIEGGGAGLYVDCGHLTVTSSTFDQNDSDDKGGGLYADGDEFTLSNSTFTGNQTTSRGGGIQIGSNTAVVSDTTVSGNFAEDGAGVSTSYYSDVTILSTTISGNIADDNGGGVFVGNEVTTIANSTIANSTIANNTATNGNGGGIAVHGWELYFGPPTGLVHFDSTLNLFQSTISGNTAASVGDGLYLYALNVHLRGGAAPLADGKNAAKEAEDKKAEATARLGAQATTGVGAASVGPITINGTIIAANPGGQDVAAGVLGASVTADHSLFGGVINVTVSGAGNQTGVTNPGLGALANNGGPTMTMKLLAGSPAIDTGPAAASAFPGNGFDQRGAGHPRVINGVTDAGAYEAALTALFTG